MCRNKTLTPARARVRARVHPCALTAVWDHICGNSFRIHLNTLCSPKCQSPFLVTFHDFMLLINGAASSEMASLSYISSKYSPVKKIKARFCEIISVSYHQPAHVSGWSPAESPDSLRPQLEEAAHPFFSPSLLTLLLSFSPSLLPPLLFSFPPFLPPNLYSFAIISTQQSCAS